LSSAKQKLVRKPLSEVIKPWGKEELLAHTDIYALKLIHVKKGFRPSLQYHQKKTESLYLLSGRMRVEAGKTPKTLAAAELHPGQVVDVPCGRVHRLMALEDSVIIEVSTSELDDVVRLEDDYGRT
jgi:mannose-6-phosphate isomerase-like protein (cupin superfamily)